MVNVMIDLSTGWHTIFSEIRGPDEDEFHACFGLDNIERCYVHVVYL